MALERACKARCLPTRPRRSPAPCCPRCEAGSPSGQSEHRERTHRALEIPLQLSVVAIAIANRVYSNRRLAIAAPNRRFRARHMPIAGVSNRSIAIAGVTNRRVQQSQASNRSRIPGAVGKKGGLGINRNRSVWYRCVLQSQSQIAAIAASSRH